MSAKLLLSCLLLMALSLPLRAAPPANDNFANAVNLGAIAPATGSVTNMDATLETGEPLPVSTAVASVWWKWTAPATARFQMDTNGSSPNTAMGVYTGTAVGSLTTIATNDNATASVTYSRVFFDGVQGTTYSIQVMTASVGRGLCRVNILQRPPEGSDAFATATDLGQAATANGGGFIQVATMETGEPKIPTGFWDRSLWWKWKAPATGVVEINTVGSAYNTALAIYTGTSLTALTRVAWNNDIVVAPTSFQSRVRFPAIAGTTYLIQVAGSSSTTVADTALEIKPGPIPPANDSFSASTNLGSVGTTTVTGTNVNATLEIGEPTPVSEQTTTQSVWWRWTAPVSGQVDVNTTGSAFNTILAVFTGTSVSTLTLKEFNDNAANATAGESKLSFPAVAGTTYHIQVSARTGPTPEGAITLTIASGLAGAVNDNFAAATNLGSAATTTVTGTNFGATMEAGEPSPGGTGSVWWRWTAPATGPVEINTLGSDINSRLTIYTGSTLGSLVMMITNDTAVGVLDGSGNPPSEQSLVRIHAVAGTVYFIQVLGVDSGDDDNDRGAITLTVKPGPAAPANDNFAAAANLGSAATVSVTVDGTYATLEAGEPVPVTQGVVLQPDWHLHATLWWKWTAPATGWILIKPGVNPGINPPSTLIGVYTGSTLATLQQTSNRIRATAGTVYMIQASYWDGPSTSGPMTVEIIPMPDPPPNDNLANAINLGSAATLSVTGTTLNASTEAGEPNPHYISEIPLGPTSWWKWTPPATGRVQVTITGADIAAYTGTPAFDSFTGKRNLQTTPTGFTWQWQVIAGVTYYIQANDMGNGAGVSFQVVPSATPADGYAGWIAAIPGFTTAQHHPEADPDRDGVPSGLEYILGRTPHQWQPWPFTPEIVTQGANRYVALHFTLPAGYTTLVNALLKVQESTDLLTWQTAGEQYDTGNWSVNTERWTDAGITHIRIRTSVPIQSSQPKAWLRPATRVTW